MDDTDASRTDASPFDEDLTRAVRRVGGDGPVDEQVDGRVSDQVDDAVEESSDDQVGEGVGERIDRSDEGPFDESLTPAVRPIGGGRWSDRPDDGRDGPFGTDLVPAFRRVDGVGRDRAGRERPGRERPGRERPGRERSGAAAPPTVQADVEDLLGPKQTLEPRIQLVWILQSGVSAAVFSVVASVAFALFAVGEPWYGMVIFSVLFGLGSIFAILRYRIWRYEVRDDSLFLKRGVVTRVTTVAPYVRIQHVDVRRGAIERAFGLATTVVYTAGSRGADVSIPGLTPERADDLQDRLKQLAIAAEGEDAV